MPKQKKRWIILGIVLFLLIVGFLFIANWRTIGKQMANPLRDLLGIERVAQLETAIFEVQDKIEGWKYDLGLAQAENPFEVASSSGESHSTQILVSTLTETIPPTATFLPTEPSV